MQREDRAYPRKSEFWGICCDGGKKYSQVVKQRFHLTMAALDPTVVPTSPVVSLMVDRRGCEYLICSLKPSTVLQVNLNLYFDKGENVTFSLRGQGKIHLSGYHIYDEKDDKESSQIASNVSPKKPQTVTKDMIKNKAKTMSDSDNSSDEENANLKLNSQKEQNVSPKKQPSLVKSKQSSITVDGSNKSSGKEENKQKKKNKAIEKIDAKRPKKSEKSEETEDDDDDDDDDDEEDDDDAFDGLDDSMDDTEDDDEEKKDLKKDGKKLQAYKRLWSSLTQSDEDEEETDDSDSDDDEDAGPKNKVVQDKKKLKQIETSTPILGQKQAQNTTAKALSDKSSLLKKTPNANDSLLNSSVGRTPMPQKKTPKQTNAVTPKKVTFTDSDDSSDSDNDASPSKKQQSNESSVPPTSEKKKKKKKKKNSLDAMNSSNISEGGTNQAKQTVLSAATYSKKLPGGLEYEDIGVGNGPIAKNGRLVHVYYTGRLENNKVFDSREPGNKPFSFKLGSGNVIKGWDLGIEGMKVGGKRRLKVPASLGYKNQKTGPIPANSTLYFTVELKSVS